ncbi:OmpA family protein [Paracoccus xiamenensis]|uniref:OmpA family protein n=1 Tax=Paracoccus xiamenensis TaxID=2714901 RepID=UPI0014082541|nr:OmpA family protein [Paracoccus xiamenensis]NHF74075.1 OmpA family protein [Paracoccus xiamenensis]
MPRFTANSTALAALLSLGLGVPAAAEIVLPDDAAKTRGAERAESLPGLSALLTAERAAGLQNADLSCLDGSARPCADDMPLVTPAGVAVQLSEGGEIILAPTAQQPFRITNGQPVVRDSDFSALAEARLADATAQAAQLLGEAPTAEDETSEAADASATDEVTDQAEAVNETETAEAPAKLEEPAAEAATEEQAETAPTEAAEAAPEAEPPAEVETAEAQPADAEDQPEADALAEKLTEAKEKAEAALSTEADPAQDELAKQLAAAAAGEQPAAALVATEDSHAGDEPRMSAAEIEERLPNRVAAMPGLNAVLQAEIADGLTADGLACIDGTPRPCAEDVALVSPKGVAVNVGPEGQIIIGQLGQQQYTVGEDGKLRARGSNTAAAKEAAEGAKPKAAALDDSDAADAEVVTETLTEDSVRSSDQDFETKIADAIKTANALQGSGDSGDDGGSDLASIALAGLGALAVGEILQGNREVALNTGDRVIVTRNDGSQQVLKDDNMLLRQPGNELRTENYADGSSRTVVVRPDGSQIITIRGADLGVLRRIHVAADGTETVLIDEAVEVPPVQVSDLPPAPKPEATAPTTEAALREALAREAAVNRHFTLGQIRSIPEVRNLVAPVDIDAITFDTGSAAINPDQARQLATLGTVLEDAIKTNPREVFLIEGHTDAVGSATYNLALSDRRAESVALALAEYFDVPPENMVVQGYGEEYLKVPVLTDERDNRRASVRRITDLLAAAQ